MRKSIIAAIAVIIFSATSTAPVSAGLGFRISGGFTHISYSDYNDWADYVNTTLAGVTSIENIRWIPEFSAELYYPFSPMIEVGVGLGIMTGSSELAVSQLADSYLLEHGIKAYPFTANLYFRPSVPFVSMKPYLYGGGALYYSSMDFSLSVIEGGETSGYEAEMSTWGLGLHGGGGIEFSIAPSISLDIGFRLRWADISGFEGTATSHEGETKDVFLATGEIGGVLLYGTEDIAEKDDYDEGSLDLSGYSLYIGITSGF